MNKHNVNERNLPIPSFRPAWFVVALLFSCFWVPRDLSAEGNRIDFLAAGDTQYHAKKTANPEGIDAASKKSSERLLTLISNLPRSSVNTNNGTVRIPKSIRGLLIAGDLIDSLDKHGSPYEAMQKAEWKRFLADFGLTGKEGRIPFPVYETYGNHDGPQGRSFLVQDIITRNKSRPGVVNVSENGIHYSWDWGPVHFVSTGMFVGKGEKKREDHHYAARGSLKFLRRDLQRQVGDSNRPVVIIHHLDIKRDIDYDWPEEDKKAYYNAIKPYNVIAIIHGHTHADPHMYRWNGKKAGGDVKNGVRVFDTGDACASKIHNGEEVGSRHGFLYGTIVNRSGVNRDQLRILSFFTKDRWKTKEISNVWKVPISIP